jgi:hypothetical protein
MRLGWGWFCACESPIFVHKCVVIAEGEKNMWKRSLSRLLFLLPVVLGGCGIYVPGMQEVNEPQDKVGPDKNALIGEIKCEIRNGVWNAVHDPNFFSPSATTGNSADWLLGWGVKADLQITVDDKGTFGPGATFTSPFGTAAQTVSFGLGIQTSTEAQRKEEIGFAYSLKDLVTEVDNHRRYLDPSKTCGANGVFIHSDLKIGEFINQNVFIARPPGIIPNGTEPFNAFNYDLQFVIVYGASITPGWTLVRVSINPNSPFASAMRTRTQYLTLTFGPLSDTKPPPLFATQAKQPTPVPLVQLNQEAEAVHNANLIGQAVTNAIRSSAAQ